MSALILTLVCAWQAPEAAPQTRATTAAEGREAMSFDPATLPRAESGRWDGWGPATPIPAEYGPEFGAALNAYQEADYAASIAHLFALLTRAPDYPAALYQLGATYFRLRRYNDCAVVFERFAAVVPSEIGATQVLGHCYYSLGDYQRARRHYELVLAAKRDHFEAWRGLGLAFLRLGDLTEALRCLDAALERRSDHADTLVWRAQVLLELGRAAEALPSAVRGREAGPHEPRAWFVEAQILAELGREDEAERARERFLELNRLEQQIRTQEGLLLHDPRALEPLLRLVGLHRAVGNRAETKAVMMRALRTAPGELKVHALALDAFTEMGETALVDRTVTEIETRFANGVSAWQLLAAFHRSRGATDAAVAAETRAQELAAGRK